MSQPGNYDSWIIDDHQELGQREADPRTEVPLESVTITTLDKTQDGWQTYIGLLATCNDERPGLLWLNSASLREIKDAFWSKREQAYVARNQLGAAIGMVSLIELGGNGGKIANLCRLQAAKDYRVGLQLFAKVLDVAASRGMQYMRLDAVAHNKAIGMYREYRFEPEAHSGEPSRVVHMNLYGNAVIEAAAHDARQAALEHRAKKQ